MRKTIGAALLAAGIGLSGCGEDTPGGLPRPRGTLAEYLPLRAGTEFVYRRDADPEQTARLWVEPAQNGLLELILVAEGAEPLRIAMLARLQPDRLEVLRFDRGSVRIELDPPLAGVIGPLEEGLAYSSTTRIQFLGGQLGVDLLGVTEGFGEHEGVNGSWEHTFAVDANIQTDLIGRTRVELVLARDVGPVEVRVVSPAIEQLGLEGVELRLELLSGPSTAGGDGR